MNTLRMAKLKQGAAVLLPLLLLSGCPAPQISGGGSSDTNVLSFQEQVNVQIPNDTMHITLLIEAQHPRRKEAAETVNRRLADLQALLKTAGGVKVQLGDRHVYPQREGRKILYWQDSLYLNLRGTDFEAMGRIIDESQDLAHLNGLSFSLSAEKRAQALEEAAAQALDGIRGRAAFLSGKLGFSGYDLLKVEMHDHFERGPVQPAPAYGVAAEAAAAPKMDITPGQSGEQGISQTVRVTVRMK